LIHILKTNKTPETAKKIKNIKMIAQQPQSVSMPTQPQATFQSASLYVGDLHNDVTEGTLFELFNRVGPVASIRVCRDAVTRRSLGYAYVNFHSMVDAERALDTLNFQGIKDRPCRIMWSHRDPSIRKNTRANIFVKNLAPTIDSKQLYDTFSQFGNILSCKVAMEGNGSSKGFGYVHFETEEVAQKAIDAVNEKLVAGKKIYVGKFERRTERSTTVSRYTNVYVKNLPQEWDEQKLKDSFGQYGTITSIAFKKNQDRHNGLGYGFVNFETHEQATKAVTEGSKLIINGQQIFVDRFQKKQERQALLSKIYEDRKRERTEKFKNMNLYVKNLDDDVDDSKLRELFSPFGETTSIVVMKDQKGASRGFGFVCFSNPDDASKALTELNGKVVGSKPLYVNRAQRKEERKTQLEVAFLSGQRVPQPIAMYYPPNMPIQHMMFAPPQQQFRNRPPQQFPPMSGMRAGGYQQQVPPYYGQNPRGRNQQQTATRGGYAAGSRGGNPKARGAYTGAPRYPRDAVSSVMQPVMMQPSQELSAPMLANASPEMQKQILGERLYPLVYKDQPELAAKITGMFLEMETSEILALLDSPTELNNKIQEALAVLNSAN